MVGALLLLDCHSLVLAVVLVDGPCLDDFVVHLDVPDVALIGIDGNFWIALAQLAPEGILVKELRPVHFGVLVAVQKGPINLDLGLWLGDTDSILPKAFLDGRSAETGARGVPHPQVGGVLLLAQHRASAVQRAIVDFTVGVLAVKQNGTRRMGTDRQLRSAHSDLNKTKQNKKTRCNQTPKQQHTIRW